MRLTWLYVPGDRPDRFVKAVDSGADVVILDLEDAVAPSRKEYARRAVAEFLTQPHPVPVTVRVGELAGPELLADLEAVARAPGLSGLRLPKVQAPGDVVEVARRLDTPTELYCLLESAVGVESAYQIARAHPWVTGIGLGEADLRADLNVTDDAGLAWARSRIVVASAAAELGPPAMSVYPNVADEAGLAESCRLGRRLGFLGRAALHPRQLPVIVEAFRPSPAEVERATELLAALEEAELRQSGTVVLPDGRFADRAMVAAARRTVALAARLG